MNTIQITDLCLYPVKSCATVSLKQMRIDNWGPVGDRRFMLTDSAGQFVTARKLPALLQIQPRYLGGDDQWGSHLGLQHPRHAPLTLEIPQQSSALEAVNVWKDRVTAIELHQGSHWFSQILGQPLRLVYMPESTVRAVPFDTSGATMSRLGFADAYPLLAVSRASHRDFVRRLPHPIPISRFRANLVVDSPSLTPWSEDRWVMLESDTLKLKTARPCSRCVIPTIDPETQELDPGVLRTLASFRHFDEGILFGQNMFAEGYGSLHLQQTLTVTLNEPRA